MLPTSLPDRDGMAEIYANSILAMFAIFLLGFFLFPDAPSHYKYYHWFMLLALFVARPFIKEVIGDSVVMLTAVFAGYMALSGLWSVPFDGMEYLFALRSVLAVLLYIVLLIGFASRFPERFELFLQLMCLVAAVMALASLVVFYTDNPFPTARVHGIGRIYIINRGAAAYGVFAMVAAGYCFRHVGWKRYLFGLLVLILLAFVVMSQTRSAIIAVVAGLLVLAVSEIGRKAFYVIASMAVLALAMKLAVPELWTSLNRSMPLRPAIWLSAIEQIKHAPLFGYGLLSDTAVSLDNAGSPRTFRHIHNAYLAAARDGGLVGLLLLLAVVTSAYATAIRVFRSAADARPLALMVYATLVIIPIQDRLFTKPKEYWLFFWLPVALVVIYNRRLSHLTGHPGTVPLARRPADAG